MKSSLNQKLGALQKKLFAAEIRLKKHHEKLGALPARHGYKTMEAFIAALQTVTTPDRKKAAPAKKKSARKPAGPAKRVAKSGKPGVKKAPFKKKTSKADK